MLQRNHAGVSTLPSCILMHITIHKVKVTQAHTHVELSSHTHVECTYAHMYSATSCQLNKYTRVT